MAAGILLCTAWFYTILAGFFSLYCPVMYLMFLHHKLYRKLVDLLFALWELYPVALFQLCFRTKIHHFGDYVNPNENTIIIMNHRTRIDWNYVWLALYHATQDPKTGKCICKEKMDTDSQKYVPTDYSILDTLDISGKSKIKFVLKDEIKTIPGMGWIMQLNYFLYVKRNWQEDQQSIAHFTDYYTRVRCPCRVVLFPEGTDLSADNRHRSDRYATAHSLQLYEYVLHPRTTGWVALCSRLRNAGLTSVFDVTVAYDKPAQTEVDLMLGTIPKHVYFHFKRYSIEQVPREEEELRNWLKERWRDKEESLRKFHYDGTYKEGNSNKEPKRREERSMYLAKLGFIFWTILDVAFMYGLLYSAVVQFWVIYHSVLFIFVTWYFGGFHKIQYKLLENCNI